MFFVCFCFFTYGTETRQDAEDGSDKKHDSSVCEGPEPRPVHPQVSSVHEIIRSSHCSGKQKDDLISSFLLAGIGIIIFTPNVYSSANSYKCSLHRSETEIADGCLCMAWIKGKSIEVALLLHRVDSLNTF